MKTCKKGHTFLTQKKCPVCKKNWQEANKLKTSIANKKWLDANKASRKISDKAWKIANKDRVDLNCLRWRLANAGKKNAYNKRYEASKLNRTPAWLSQEQLNSIELYYKAAHWIASVLNEKIEVDHIVPLQGDNVSGLHVP